MTKKLKNTIRRIMVSVAPKFYSKYHYKRIWGFYPNLKMPKRFTEKLIWRIVYDHNPLYTQLADKVAVRDWVSDRLGGQKPFPKCYGIYNDPSEIAFDLLPDKFVLKSNHASGHVIICNDKSKLDKQNAIEVMKKWLNTNYYYEWGEWQYKNIKPRIICEELLEDDIVDYRFFCFDGKVAFCWVTIHDHNAYSGYCGQVYTEDWKKLDFEYGDYDTHKEFPKPENLKEMVEMASKLSVGFDYVRVDLYTVKQKTYFAEMTFTSNGGSYRIKPDEWDYKLGEMWKMDK